MIFIRLLILLLLLLPLPAHAAEIQIKKISTRIFEISGGSGAQAWHIQYGAEPAGGMRLLTLPGPGPTAFFSNGNRLRRVDVEKGMITGRWRFPGARISKIEWRDDRIQVEVEEAARWNRVFRRVIDFDPESPDVPRWSTGSSIIQDVGLSEAHCCLSYANTNIFAEKVNVDQAKTWLAEAENAVRRDPLSPWLRVELGNIYRALDRPDSTELYREAARLSSDYTELFRMSGAMYGIGQMDIAREAFERGYEDYWRRGNDPRLAFLLFARLSMYSVPRSVPEDLRPEMIDRVYRLGPRTEFAEHAWRAHARSLEAGGKKQEAEEWYRRAEDARLNSLYPGPAAARWLWTFSLGVIAVFAAAVLYFCCRYLAYKPQLRARSRGETESGFRFAFLGVEYWTRAERITFLTIIATGWLAIGFLGQFVSVNWRVWTLPFGISMGSLAGPETISFFENDVPKSKERDLILAIAYHHDLQIDKAETLYRTLSDYPESWNNLGAILKDSGRSDEARQAFEHALRLNPTMAEPLLNTGKPPSDLWSELHQKHLPGRAMLAVPDPDQFRRAFAAELTAGMAVKAIQGPYAFAKSLREARGFTNVPVPALVAASALILLFVPALILALLKPSHRASQPPYRIQGLIELLLPGTAPAWKYFGGLVMVAFAYALVSPLEPSPSPPFAAGFPTLQAFALSSKADVIPSLEGPATTSALAVMVVLWIVNAVLISYSRRNAATIPSGTKVRFEGDQVAKVILPEAPIQPARPDEAESPDVWGFRDTHFDISENGHVIIRGTRYELSGKELPRFLPWVRETLEIDLDPKDVHRPNYPTTIPQPHITAAFRAELEKFLSPAQIDTDGEVRLRHGHGHTQEEMYAIKYTRLGRIPDLVVYPETDEQVMRLIEAGKKHDVSLIPYGGGTNVTDALRCNPDEQRSIVSVDMRRMNRILWIDRTNMMACIQAGAVGRYIMAELKKYDVTMGHEPDSVEFSTLGGWIATNASGMKKNRYGNIEDLVLDVTVATTSGTLQRTSALPRESVGLDLRRLMFGSEGTLGIITSAVVKIFALPEAQEYGSVLFPSFEAGFKFMYDLTREGTPPASVRLVDNLQFQFGLALKPKSAGLSVLKSRVQKFFVTKLKGFEPTKMVACTLVFEGSRAEVEQQQRTVYRIAARHGGMKAGAENGRRGYQLTYSIAYIRDFLMNYYIIAESFETSVAWSEALALCTKVKRRLEEEYAKRRLPGKPFVTSRVTQVYRTGVCIYFYFGFYYKGIPNPHEVYLELENIARDEILRSGGSLSHHHGVGKLRRAFLPRIMSKTALEWKRELKKSLDPGNIFGAGNQDL